jgi:MFS family permease
MFFKNKSFPHIPIYLFCLVAFLAPVFVYANLPNPPGYNQINASDIQNLIVAILTIVWYVFIGIAVISFMIAGIYFLLSQGDPTKAAEAKRYTIWGIVGVAVAVLGFLMVSMISSFLTPTTNTPAPTGACCRNGACYEVTENTCTEQGGDFSNFLHCNTEGFQCGPG